MRYGIISDIHGNMEAFERVLYALSKENIDEYLCLGDVVGYGADPSSCISLVRSLKAKVLIAGNHEWGVTGLTDLEYFNEFAKEAVIWTKGVLSQDELDFLKSFRLLFENEEMHLVHGSLDSPESFNYIMSDYDAYITMRHMKANLCFVGHSHSPGIFYTDRDRIVYSRGPAIKIDSERKYVINAGSIGQPRDRDPRASYVVYDDEDKSVDIRRVAYDVKSAQDKILKTSLPEGLAYRLSEGR